ncbi:MAG TPA: serine hydrolase, partial [Planctomycetia bacterium]|nr:serine hydrolase [Planctomycetia bacterium]
ILTAGLLAAPPLPDSKPLVFDSLVEASGDDVKNWFEKIKTTHRVTSLGAIARSAGPVFFGRALADREHWEARFGAEADEFPKLLGEYKERGYRPEQIAGYREGSGTKYVFTWVKDTSGRAVKTHVGLSPLEFRQALAEAKKTDLRPTGITGHMTPGGHRLSTVLLAAGDGLVWQAKFDLSAAELTRFLDSGRSQGFRPVSLASYRGAPQPLYAAVMIGEPGFDSLVSLDLSDAAFTKEQEIRKAEGYVLAALAGHARGKESRYAAVWEKPARFTADLTATGIAASEFAALDETMQRFMKPRSISAAALAVHRDGKPVYARGFGWLDRGRTRPTVPETPFRFASVTKPITAALIRKLVEAAKLKPEDKAFGLLGITATKDARLQEITIAQLLSHSGGWDRDLKGVNPFLKDKAFDPMFFGEAIRRDLGRSGPPAPADYVAFMAQQPLQFDPGSRNAYSNFGYCMLGRVAEKVGGAGYFAVLEREILKPLGLKTMALAHSLPKDRDPKEPRYVDDGIEANVFDLEGSLVPRADGGFLIEAMDSHGGLIGSAPDLCRFLDAYGLDGRPRNGRELTLHFNGSLPGTWAWVGQLPGGISYAALFNRREDPTGLEYSSIRKSLDAAITKALAPSAVSAAK